MFTAMARCRLLLAAALVVVVVAAALLAQVDGRAPVPTWTAAARRYAGDDQVVVLSAYAGRTHHHPLVLQVRWPEAPTPAAYSDIWLPSSDPLFQHEASDAVDRESPLGDPQLQLVARGRESPWRIGTSLGEAAAALPDGDQLLRAKTAKARGILSLAWPNATLWARYAAVEYTGSRLVFASADAADAAAADNTTNNNWLPAAGAALLLRGQPIASNLRLEWSPEAALTTIPVAPYLAAVRDGGPTWALQLQLPDGRRVPLVTAGQVRAAAAPLLAADLQSNSTTIRIGRRLAAALAVGWTALPGTSASGWQPRYVVHWAKPLDDAARDVAAALGFVLAFLLGYLASHLLTHVRLLSGGLWRARVVLVPATSVTPLGNKQDAPPPSATTMTTMTNNNNTISNWRPYRQAWIVLVVGTAAHVLALLFAGHGVLVDTLLEQPLRDFTVALAATSLPLALLLVAELARALARGTPHDRSPWTAVAFAAVHSAVVARSLVATMLVAAGTSMLALVMLAVTYTLTVLFPSLYTALLLTLMTLARPRTDYGRRSAVWPGVWYAHTLVAVGAAAVNVVAGYRWLLVPLLDVANALYPSLVIHGAVWWLLVFSVLAALGLLAFEQMEHAAGRLYHHTIIVPH